jgi:hypothetical protein
MRRLTAPHEPASVSGLSSMLEPEGQQTRSNAGADGWELPAQVDDSLKSG